MRINTSTPSPAPAGRPRAAVAPGTTSRLLATASAVLALACVSVELSGSVQSAGADPASLRNRAAGLLDTGEDARAIEAFRDLVKNLPGSVPDRVNLGIALLTHDDLDGADRELRKALEIDARDLRARYNLGIVLKRRGENEKAVAELEAVAASAAGPRDASLQYNLGILYKRLRKSDEALAAFRKAVALRPEHASAHFQIYNELIQRGDKVEAAKELDLFKFLQKTTPDFQRREAFLERGRFTEISAPGPLPAGAAAAQAAIEPIAIRFELPGGRAGAGSGSIAAEATRRGGSSDGPARGTTAEAERAGGGAAGPARAAGGETAGPERAAGGETAGPERAAGGEAIDSARTGAAVVTAAFPAWGAATLADFDGDGNLDIATVDATGAISIFRIAPGGGVSGLLAHLDGAPGRGAAGIDRGGRGEVPHERSEGKPDRAAIAAADVDNDGDTDLFLSTPDGARLYLNDGKGSFVDGTAGSGLEAAKGASSALWFDADRDGDLDLILGGAGASGGGAPRLFLNASTYPAAGEGSGASRTQGATEPRTGMKNEAPPAPRTPLFLAAGEDAKLPPRGDAIGFADFRGRDDLDVAFASSDGTISIVQNQRGGRFGPSAPISADPGSPHPGAGDVELRTGDLDGDGRADLIVLAQGAIQVLWNDSDAALAAPRLLFRDAALSVSGLAILDADGDGDLDVVTVVRREASTPSMRQLRVLRNDGERKFTPLTDAAPDLPQGAAGDVGDRPGGVRLLAGDLDGDGDPDLAVVVAGDTSPIVLTNVTKTPNRFVKVKLVGTKSSRSGVGSRVEVRAGRLIAIRTYEGIPLPIGIGPRGRADSVRVIWPTGVTQDIVDVGSGSAKLEEKREFAGSCPFLYAWDGSTFRFVGEALSGAPIGFLRPDGAFETPRPLEHLRLPPGLPAPSGSGSRILSLRMTEEMRELTALDSVRLVAVDHPEGVEVHSNERIREAGPEPFRFLALEDLRAPVAAAEVRVGEAVESVGTKRTASEPPARPVEVGGGAGRVHGKDRSGNEPGNAELPSRALSRLSARGASLTESLAANALSSLDGVAASGFVSLGPRLEGLAEPHVLVLLFEGNDERAGGHAGSPSYLAQNGAIGSHEPSPSGSRTDPESESETAQTSRSDADRGAASDHGHVDRGPAIERRNEEGSGMLDLRRSASDEDRSLGVADSPGHSSGEEHLALVLDGWVSWTTSDVSRALLQTHQARERAARGAAAVTSRELIDPEPIGTDRSQPRPGSRAESAAGQEARFVPPTPERFGGVALPPEPDPWGPALEVRSGDRLMVDPDLGLPIGPTMVAPLPAGAGGPRIEVRIGSSLAVYYDRIRLGRIVEAPLIVREIAPLRAELRWRGVAATRRHEDEEWLAPDYDDVAPSGPFTRLAEETTAPGDVSDLVDAPDGRLVVFGTGDEVALDFDAATLPPPARGMARTWFLVSIGYARDGDPNSEPLPWGP